MEENKMLKAIKVVLENLPSDWLKLTTHRLDIYNEGLAKVEFLEHFEDLLEKYALHPDKIGEQLSELPTAFDYIRLGHPLSCVLEWVIAKKHGMDSEHVISFSSKTTPLLAILRKNSIENRDTRILYTDHLPKALDLVKLRDIYKYRFEVKKYDSDKASLDNNFAGSTVYINQEEGGSNFNLDFALDRGFDFYINAHSDLGSVILVNGEENKAFVSEIQHVRRRESIAMTPVNTLVALKSMIEHASIVIDKENVENHKARVVSAIADITGAPTKALVASSGLSIQYAIMMGLVDHAAEYFKGKDIKFIVPPNCYGGTNDQARRVAACIDNVEIVDLPVDGGKDMVEGIELVLSAIAKEDAVPYIIAEIPTNPRVEVPDLLKLKEVLSVKRKTADGSKAIDPVFILDQTFCPNVHFLGEGDFLSTMRAISYASGSKFPSGGLCTAGYCIGNTMAEGLMKKIETHLKLCDNEATYLQMEILAKQLPSMNQRIQDAYTNTRDFVNFIQENLPTAKINFVSEELASEGFTPSVFSLDLPTKGNSPTEKEAYKRKLNHRLINLMITELPDESKYCVSYGQLKGCYWTIPATSTQGTTKEGDKDYIARVALSANMDMELHKKVFLDFVRGI